MSSAGRAREQGLAIFEDLVFYDAPDGFLWRSMPRPARCAGKPRSTTSRTRPSTPAAPIVADGKVITEPHLRERGRGCYIAAHDAMTGKEVWKFYTHAGARRAGRRHLGQRAARTSASRVRGACPAPTIPCASCSTGRSPIPSPYTRFNATAASTPLPLDAARRPLQQLDCRARRRDRQAGRGTTSTCRATTGTRTICTSARSFAPRSIPTRGS